MRIAGQLDDADGAEKKHAVDLDDTASGQLDMCADIKAVDHGCNELALRSDGNGGADGSITAFQLSEYFAASPAKVAELLEALGVAPGTDFLRCSALCSGSLRLVEQLQGWTIPARRGSLCAQWAGGALEPDLVHSATGEALAHAPGLKRTCLRWVGVGEKAMQATARSLDSQWQDVQSTRDAADVILDDDVRPSLFDAPGGGSSDDEWLQYATSELALRVANIFDIFPSPPSHASSLAEREVEVLPPKFGPEVNPRQYVPWQEIVLESQAWVDTALRNLPANPQLLQAWFGHVDNATYRSVRRVMLGMVQTLSLLKVNVGLGPPRFPCSQASNILAYVRVSRKDGWTERELGADGYHYVINVCDRYWKTEFVSLPETKFGTLIHEAAHHHGPDDETFQGSAAYGRSQCLRLAKGAKGEDGAKAVNNADNYKWFVFYVNRCTGVTTPAPAQCTLTLSPSTHKLLGPTSKTQPAVRVAAKCTKEVQGLWLSFFDRSGRHQREAVHFGGVGRGLWVLGEYRLQRGTVVNLFFESHCSLHEANVIWAGGAGAGDADLIHGFAPSRPEELWDKLSTDMFTFANVIILLFVCACCCCPCLLGWCCCGRDGPSEQAEPMRATSMQTLATEKRTAGPRAVAQSATQNAGQVLPSFERLYKRAPPRG